MQARFFDDNTSHSESVPVVQKGKWPYTFVNQSDAAKLAKTLGNNEVKSDLINSYAWDTAIIFIQEFSNDNDYSKQAGKNTINDLQKTGESILLSDNQIDKRCNIYDLSGNTREWSTETYNYGDSPCTRRGSFYNGTDVYTET